MTNVQVVKDVYRKLGRGDIEGVLALWDPEMEWREAEGNPFQPDGAPWIGAQTIMQKVLGTIATSWDGFGVTPHEIHDGGDAVVVEGRYTGTWKTSGNKLDAQFCHVWKVRDGKVVTFQQYVDTAQMQQVMGTRELNAAGSA